MTIYFCEGNYFILIILFQHTHQISLHIFVDFTVAGEGATAFFVAAEGADQVRVLNLFIEVAHEAATGQVGGCDFVERADFLLAGGWVIDYYRTGKAGIKKHLLDCNIVLLLRDQREEFIEWAVLISLESFLVSRKKSKSSKKEELLSCFLTTTGFRSLYISAESHSEVSTDLSGAALYRSVICYLRRATFLLKSARSAGSIRIFPSTPPSLDSNALALL